MTLGRWTFTQPTHKLTLFLLQNPLHTRIRQLQPLSIQHPFPSHFTSCPNGISLLIVEFFLWILLRGSQFKRGITSSTAKYGLREGPELIRTKHHHPLSTPQYHSLLSSLHQPFQYLKNGRVCESTNFRYVIRDHKSVSLQS